MQTKEKSSNAFYQASTQRRRPHTLTIVQNLPVPMDRHVWPECRALIDRGYQVSVSCPKGIGDTSSQHIDDVSLRLRLGEGVRSRAVKVRNWWPQAGAYVRVYDELSGTSSRVPAAPRGTIVSDTDPRGRRYVPLDAPVELRRYLAERSAP